MIRFCFVLCYRWTWELSLWRVGKPVYRLFLLCVYLFLSSFLRGKKRIKPENGPRFNVKTYILVKNHITKYVFEQYSLAAFSQDDNIGSYVIRDFLV